MRALGPLMLVAALLLGACAPPLDEPAPEPPEETEPAPEPPEETEPAPEPPEETESPPLPVPAAPPDLAVVATGDHRLVVVDRATGEEVRALASYDDPETFEEETDEPFAGGSFFDSVAVSADLGTVYVAVCCEPAPGRLYRVPLGGGEPEQIAHGYEPAVLAEDQLIAVTEMQWLSILEPDGERVRFFEPDSAVAVGVGRPAWSPDGRLVAFELYEAGMEDPRLMLLDVDTAEAMADARPLPRADARVPWSRPTFDHDGRLVIAEQPLDERGRPTGAAALLTVDVGSGEVHDRRDLPAGVRTLVHDASGAWLLAVLTDGTARWWGPEGQEGTFGDGLLAAAW